MRNLSYILLHLREWLAVLAAGFPVAATVGGLALDDDTLAAERTWFAYQWVGFILFLGWSLLRFWFLCRRFLLFRFFLEIFLCHDGDSSAAVIR